MGIEKYSLGLVNKVEDLFNPMPIVIFICVAGFASYHHHASNLDYRSQRKTKNRFKKIMDNSEEGIIIVKDKIIDYINDKFLQQ